MSINPSRGSATLCLLAHLALLTVIGKFGPQRLLSLGLIVHLTESIVGLLWVRGYDLHSSKLLCICQLTRTTAAPVLAFIVEWLYNVHAGVGVVEECYLVDPASSHMLVSKIKPCMFKKLVVGPWVGSTGPPRGVHRSARPFCRRCAPGLNWPGRASGAVTLKKLECSKQAYALDTLAWDNIIGFRSYSVGLRDRSND
ncbi:hypothetical protein Ddye_032543 [Dipteronia dyeriana]|uniref:Uncharacterized protein n=1 Tax=Dipteronia dyeriana TaxID=168575 RepID=A0AAD9TCD6_9ROSI|nr:hypothetical protein Ddye_032543 [Dipteronia dyeriana]